MLFVFSLCVLYVLRVQFFFVFFFFKQKTAYEMRISDWSSDVCSSDLLHPDARCGESPAAGGPDSDRILRATPDARRCSIDDPALPESGIRGRRRKRPRFDRGMDKRVEQGQCFIMRHLFLRSEEHTSEIQSLMRHSYAVFCLKKK